MKTSELIEELHELLAGRLSKISNLEWIDRDENGDLLIECDGFGYKILVCNLGPSTRATIGGLGENE